MGAKAFGRRDAAQITARRARTALVAVIAVGAASLAILVPSLGASADDLGKSLMFLTSVPTTINYGQPAIIYGQMVDSSDSCNGPGQDCDNPTGQAYVDDDRGDGQSHIVGGADVVPIHFTHKRSTFAISLNTLSLAPGVHNLNVYYAGNFRAPDDPTFLSLTVLENTCTVTLEQSSSISKPGGLVTFKATLSGTGNIDTGSIVFADAAGVVADVPLVSRQASYSTAGLDNGTTHLNAGWSGTTFNKGCTAGIDHLVDADPPPEARDETVITDFQTPVVFSPLANDYSLDHNIRLEFQDSPENGDIEDNSDGTYTYTPFDDFVGEDDVHYVVYDDTGQGSAEAHTHFIVGCITEALDDSYTNDFASTLTVTGLGVKANDRACDQIAYVHTPPAHGTLTFDGSGGGFTYVPDEFWAGVDSFIYGYDDEFGTLAVATITTDSLPVPPPTTTTTTTTEATTTTEPTTTTTEATTTTGSTTTSTTEATTTTSSTTTTTGSTTTTTTGATTTTTEPAATTTTTEPTATTTTTTPPLTTTTTATTQPTTTTSTTSTTRPPSTTTTTEATTTTTTPATTTTTTTGLPPTGTTVPPAPTSRSEALVASLYRDLLGRAPSPASLGYWAARLDAGDSPRKVISALLGSAEYRRVAVTRTYLVVLGRRPDAKALAAWSDRLAAGGSLDDLRAHLIGSDEFWTKAGGTTARFVDAAYRQVLGREPDAGGRAFVEALLADGHGRPEVTRWLLATAEADRHLADTWYRMILDRPATSTEATRWATALHAGRSEASLVADLLASSEYLASI